MAGTLTLDAVLLMDRVITRRYKFVPNGSYASGTGENIDFTTALNPKKLERPMPPQPPGGPLPNEDNAKSVKTPGGYDSVLLPAGSSPTLKNFNLKYYTSGGTELGSGAYPAALLDDVVLEVSTSVAYS